MIELAYLVFFVLAAFGTGSLVLSAARLRFHSFAEELFFSVGLGYGIIAMLTYLLGFFGGLHRQAFALLFIILLALSFVRIKHLSSQLLLFSRTKPGPNIFSILLLIIVFFAFFNLVASLAPPWSYDTTMYHLTVPKIYADEHGFVALPSLLQSNWVMVPHMLFLAAILIKNGVLANLVNFTFSILLAMGIYSFGSRFFGKNTGILAAAIFFTLPITTVHSVSAHADLPLAFFAFSAFYAFVIWFGHGSNRLSHSILWLVISALMTGLAASSKMTGLVIIPIMAFLIIFYELFMRGGAFQTFQSVQLRPRLKSISPGFAPRLALFCLVAVAAAFPAYLKNIIYSGNPFFPLFYNIFGGNFLNDAISKYFSAETSYGTGISLVSFLLLPWNMTMHPLKFVDLLGIGPLFLAFVPLLLFVKRNRIAVMTIAAGLLCLVAWFLTSQALRYAIYALPFFSVVSAYVIISLSARPDSSNYSLRYLIIAVVAAVFVFNTALLFGANAKQLPVALGLLPEKEFFAKLDDGNIYGVCKFANSHLPASSRILLLYENRGYHCDAPYLLGDPREQAYIDYSKLSSAEGYAIRLKEVGVTHILVNRASPIFKPGAGGYTNETAKLIDAVIETYGTLIYSERGAELYSFSYQSPQILLISLC